MRIKQEKLWSAYNMEKTENAVRSRLLEAGMEEFRDRGFLKASLRAICKKADVTTGALYFFFESKSALFEEIVEETVEKLQACETVEEAQRFLEDFQKGLKTGEPALDQKNYLIREAADYIRQNLSRGDISLDEIADHLMISKSYLCRLFQKNLGISVQQYIYHTRIEQAKEYLNDFRLKIYEVAELTGFNSSTHFNIVFKKIMRCTPAEYRNGLKQ